MQTADLAPPTPRAAAFAAWTAGAMMFGLASDLAQPLGDIAIFILLIFVTGMAATLVLSVIPGVREMMRASSLFCLIGALVFATIVGLQRQASPEGDARRLGFIAAALEPVAEAQTTVIRTAAPVLQLQLPDITVQVMDDQAPASPSATPSTLASSALLNELAIALSHAEPSERLRAAREALASDDPAFRASAMDRLYRTGDPVLRQTVILAILRARAGRPVPVIAFATDGQDAERAAKLQGRALDLRTDSVDIESGGIRGGYCGYRASGTVSRTGFILSGHCAGQDFTMSLHPTDDFRLQGEAHFEDGKVVSINMPLG